jgi:hypothetical protein
MKTYTVLYAEDVPHYGSTEIRAENDAAAIEAAKANEPAVLAIDPDHENGICKRIVHIEGEDGEILATDIALDDCFLRYGGQEERRLCEASPVLFAALEAAHEQLECLIDSLEPGKDPDAEAVLAEVRAALAWPGERRHENRVPENGE